MGAIRDPNRVLLNVWFGWAWWVLMVTKAKWMGDVRGAGFRFPNWQETDRLG